MGYTGRVVLVRIWMLLLAIALVTSTVAAPELPVAETVELIEHAFDDAVTETAAPAPPPVARHVEHAATTTLPPSPPLSSIFRPPRLPT